MRKHGGYEYCMINKMRNVFTSFRVITGSIIDQVTASNVIYHFLNDLKDIDKLINQFSITMNRFMKIQKKLKEKVETKDSKIHAISQAWD